MPGVSLDISPGSKLHSRIITGVRDRVRASKTEFQEKHKQWSDAEERALAYLPEREIDAKRRIQREQGKPQYTTIQVPYSYAVMMASHTYWTTVFLSRTPPLQYTGRHGESMQKVQAVEAIIDYQVQVGKMLVPMYGWLYDAGKYGIGVVGDSWEDRTTTVSEIQEVEQEFLGIKTGKTRKKKITRRVPGYSGNKLRNVRPLDFLPDPRVPMHRFQDGEYVAEYNEVGWNAALRRKEQGLYINLEFVSKERGFAVGEREVGSPELALPDLTTFGLESDKKKGAVIPIYECYIDLIPNAWGLGRGTMPEKWVFTVTADFKHVIGAQPTGWYHDEFPYQVIVMEPERYALVSRGIPDILEPVQNTIDFLINQHFYNVRKALNDQFIVDPSRAMMVDFEDPLPGGLIRLSPLGYGSDPKTVATQLPVVDITANHMRDMQSVVQIGERTLGVSDQLLGTLQQGGRRSATEVRTAATASISRLKTSSEFMSAMGWGPMSQMLVQNTQQMFDEERAFRIVGDLAQEAGKEFITVTPDTISGFYDFVPVDGTMPLDRFAQANLWRELLNQMRQTPELLMRYDIGRIFEWVAQLAGLKNIKQFRVQVAPDEALMGQAQQGNVVPIAAGAQDLTRVPEPGQVSQLGTTG